MVYSVDAAVEVLDALQPNFWQMAFQRDNRLHIVSEEAVAVISPGLPCSPELSGSYGYPGTIKSHWERHTKKKFPLITEDGKIIPEEKPYFDALARNPDGEGTSLKDFFAIRERFRELKDDGQIRMINHSSNYHSHKHGYAGDGVDVFTTGLRVMFREEYFDLLRRQEERARDKIGEKDHDGYAANSLPGVAIITPYALVSFPFPASLELDRRGNAWSDETEFREGIVEFPRNFSKFDESPYNFNIMLNGGRVGFSPENFEAEVSPTLERIANLKNACTPLVRKVIDETNALHNEQFAEEIARFKSR
jgi:hypothetical protein